MFVCVTVGHDFDLGDNLFTTFPDKASAVYYVVTCLADASSFLGDEFNCKKAAFCLIQDGFVEWYDKIHYIAELKEVPAIEDDCGLMRFIKKQLEIA